MRRIATITVLIVAAVSGGCHDPSGDRDAGGIRIVSFSPALTDLLYDIGLGDHVVGVTRYCMPPAGCAPRVVGDRANVRAEPILSVRPDVLLIQQNPDDFGVLRGLAPDLRIEHVRIETLADIAAAVERIALIAGRGDLGRRRKAEFQADLDAVRTRVAGMKPKSVLFVTGYDPPSTGGRGTFVDEMIGLAGGTNAASARGYAGWKKLNRENILAMKPEVLVCQVPPGDQARAREYWQTLDDLPAVRDREVFLVTDRRWTIPSMRSAELAGKLAEMIHGDRSSAGGGDD